MRTLLVLLMLATAALAAPTASAEPGYELPDELDCYIIVIQTGGLFSPGPVRDNYVFVGGQACTAYGFARGLTDAPIVGTVRDAVAGVLDDVREGRACTEATPIGEAPSVVECWTGGSVTDASATRAASLDVDPHRTWENAWCSIQVFWASPDVQENWDFVVARSCEAGHLVIGLTEVPLVQTVLDIVAGVVDDVQEGVDCTEATPIGDAPDAIDCFLRKEPTDED